MAIHAPITGAPLCAPFAPVPPAAITRILSRFDRDQLTSFISVAIDLLDVADGDTDVEANGDELDGTAGEDDFYPHEKWFGAPGCHVSDPDCCDADKEDDDPSGDTLDEHGEAPTDDGQPLLKMRPRYGKDQTLGPINEAEAYAAWQMAPA